MQYAACKNQGSRQQGKAKTTNKTSKDTKPTAKPFWEAWATTQVADYLRSGRSCVVQMEEAERRRRASSIGAAGRGKGTARERLVNIGIRPSAISTKMKRVVRLETSVCFRITRLMNNQIKKLQKSNIPRRRESDDKNAVAIVKSVSQLGCVSKDSDALVSRGRKSRGNPMQNVLEPIQKGTVHSVYAASSKYPGKERTIAWKNTSQSSSSAKSLRHEI